MTKIEQLEQQLFHIERQSANNAAERNEINHRAEQLRREIAVLKSGHRLDHGG